MYEAVEHGIDEKFHGLLNLAIAPFKIIVGDHFMIPLVLPLVEVLQVEHKVGEDGVIAGSSKLFEKTAMLWVYYVHLSLQQEALSSLGHVAALHDQTYNKGQNKDSQD